MTRYVVHARRLVGSLVAPTRNETESVECDDYREALRAAERLSRLGMAVWLYEDRHHGLTAPTNFSPSPVSTGSRLHVLAQWGPDGARRG